jgi:hypothetical protein
VTGHPLLGIKYQIDAGLRTAHFVIVSACNGKEVLSGLIAGGKPAPVFLANQQMEITGK